MHRRADEAGRRRDAVAHVFEVTKWRVVGDGDGGELCDQRHEPLHVAAYFGEQYILIEQCYQRQDDAANDEAVAKGRTRCGRRGAYATAAGATERTAEGL